uniref:Annexin n=1 Tax=Loa loa TaxID=7209 RepID=A0A1I7VR40_LOALO
MHSSSSSSLSSLTDDESTDDSVKMAKFPVSKSIPNIPDDCNVEVSEEEIVEEEAEEEYDDDEMTNESVEQSKRSSLPLIYQMNVNKNKNIRGTVIGPSDENFHPVKASEKLRQALNGLGITSITFSSLELNYGKITSKRKKMLYVVDTNEKVIIEVTVGHNNFQRQRIMNTYEYLYSRVLMDDLKDELGGFFLDTISALFIPAHNHKLNRAIAVEIACTRTTTQMKAIKNAYQTAFSNTLEKDVVVKVEGMFGVMLRLLLCSSRDEEINETNTLIEEHANLIVKDSNGIEKISHNVELFEKLFIGHSWKHIAKVIDTIDAKLGGNGHFVETQITYNGNIPDDIKNMLLTIVKISRNTQWYFAERLHDALSSSKPDYRTIMRVIVSRSEIDLSNICHEYKQHYNHSLFPDIRKICRGEYYRLLTSILSEQQLL